MNTKLKEDLKHLKLVISNEIKSTLRHYTIIWDDDEKADKATIIGTLTWNIDHAIEHIINDHCDDD